MQVFVMLGISLVAVVIAVGMFWWAKEAMDKPIGNGMINAWGGLILNLIGGMSLGLVLGPILGWVAGLATWVAVAVVFVTFGVTIGSVIDIVSDKKPDKVAQTAAMVGPSLLIPGMHHLGMFGGLVNQQITTYLAQFS
jgi:F0F1-type ATP synthase assembly protein I